MSVDAWKFVLICAFVAAVVIGEQIDKRCGSSAHAAKAMRQYRLILRERRKRVEALAKSDEIVEIDAVFFSEVRHAIEIAPADDLAYRVWVSKNQIRNDWLAALGDRGQCRIVLPGWYAYEEGLI
jgi:hypothetical protein